MDATLREGGTVRSDASIVTGIPASRGIAAGPVRLVHGVDDFDSVQPGDVIVCGTTDPAWTALFGIAAAVVTESGGILSHAAIVAREYGIPAVVAATGAMAALASHRDVSVDGTTGCIRPLTRPDIDAAPSGVVKPHERQAPDGPRLEQFPARAARHPPRRIRGYPSGGRPIPNAPRPR
ncbi:hypothetical protein D7D52_10330 [Nocardia yunnanensis]|uniref:PEP-utilising enzyme mobile domain-containing protein n=1 Tax=Nocardia yunnanensis TaxID=2382165 RepID=A0A386ZAQ5_9NOCA|nr:hypothetical protein D7D52_10330 [Nocardia yunnanensis]